MTTDLAHVLAFPPAIALKSWVDNWSKWSGPRDLSTKEATKVIIFSSDAGLYLSVGKGITSSSSSSSLTTSTYTGIPH